MKNIICLVMPSATRDKQGSYKVINKTCRRLIMGREINNTTLNSEENHLFFLTIDHWMVLLLLRRGQGIDRRKPRENVHTRNNISFGKHDFILTSSSSQLVFKQTFTLPKCYFWFQ